MQLCPVVLSVDGDMVRIVTPEGQHFPIHRRFLQPVAPAVDIMSIKDDPLSDEEIIFLSTYLKVPE